MFAVGGHPFVVSSVAAGRRLWPVGEPIWDFAASSANIAPVLVPQITSPLMTWPLMTLSILLVVCSVLLALSVLLHKGRGGGMSDLFGGGMSTSMGGTSIAERNLDRITIVLGMIWLGCILGLLTLYRFGV